MRSQRLGFLVLTITALFATACDHPSPAGPTTTINGTPIVKSATPGARTKSAIFTDITSETVTNNSPNSRYGTFVIWDYADGVNQIDVSHTPQRELFAPGETKTMTLGLKRDPCKTYQNDHYWNLPQADHYTMSDINALKPEDKEGNEHLFPPDRASCPLVDIPQPPPPPPSCQMTNTCDPQPPACVAPAKLSFGAPILAQDSGTYPSQTDLFPFALPALTSMKFKVKTADDHSSTDKPDEPPQYGETVNVLFYSAGNNYEGYIGPTTDVPENGTAHDHITTFEPATSFARDIVAVRVQVAGTAGEGARNSVKPISLEAQCPDVPYTHTPTVRAKR